MSLWSTPPAQTCPPTYDGATADAGGCCAGHEPLGTSVRFEASTDITAPLAVT